MKYVVYTIGGAFFLCAFTLALLLCDVKDEPDEGRYY
jgi:hypothetical protein